MLIPLVQEVHGQNSREHHLEHLAAPPASRAASSGQAPITGYCWDNYYWWQSGKPFCVPSERWDELQWQSEHSCMHRSPQCKCSALTLPPLLIPWHQSSWNPRGPKWELAFTHLVSPSLQPFRGLSQDKPCAPGAAEKSQNHKTW